MNTAVLGFYEPERRNDVFRWSVAAFVVLAVHLGIVAAYLALRPEGDQALAPFVAIEVVPAPVESPAAAAAAPEMVSSPPDEQELPPPPQPQSPPNTQAMVTPLPESEQPTVELPPPQKPVPMKPAKERPARASEEQRHTKAVHEPRKKATATRTQPVRAASAPTSGAASLGSKQAQVSWRSQLAAHLARYKRYPPEAEAHHDAGTVRLSFTMDRNGRVLSRHLEGSPGSAALDHEVLAMIERAQPLPAFPPSMPQTRMTLVVPIRFSLR
jgi:periplasmic protein TonB